MRKSLAFVTIWMLAVVCFAPTAFAQNLSSSHLEVSGRFGMSGGLADLAGLEALSGQPIDPADFSGLSSSKWNLGGGVAARWTENSFLRFDVTHTRLFSAAIDLPTPGEFVDVGLSLLEFTGGIEYLPIRSEGNIAPFLSAGGGLARVGARVRMDVQGTALDVGVGDSGGTYNLGAGLRVPMSDRLGLRPEIQFVHISNENFWRASFGFFYRLN